MFDSQAANASSGALFYGVVALVILAIGVTVWSLPPSVDVEVASLKSPPPVPEVVGRITGMADCKWAKDFPLPDNNNLTPIGRLFKLDSGFMEITYDCGARVILQGPVVYAVDSKTGGCLSRGKLTARLEKKKAGDGGRKVDSHLSTHPSPLFTIHTPVATITDLGTEFGVEVNESGKVTTQVFQGSVQVGSSLVQLQSPRQAQTVDQATIVRANESVRVQTGSKGIETVRIPVQPDAFVRQMPPHTLSLVQTTGMGVPEGDPDPHWQIVARNDDPDFEPRPAIVARVRPDYWLANDPARSQWISLVVLAGAPREVVYTFRTTFDLSGYRHETATLHDKFLVDDYVAAVRLNGKSVPKPPHRTHGLPRDAEGKLFRIFNDVTIESGFVAGQNTLEFDVGNGGILGKKQEGASAMGFRAELEIDAKQVSP